MSLRRTALFPGNLLISILYRTLLISRAAGGKHFSKMDVARGSYFVSGNAVLQLNY